MVKYAFATCQNAITINMNSTRFVRPILGLVCFFSVTSCGHPRNDASGQIVAESGGESGPSTAAAVAAADTATLPPMVAGDFSWPRLLGKTFDGAADSGDITFDWNVTPQVAWRLPVGDGYGLGCVADGRYYHADSILDDRQRTERLRAFDLGDGSLLWSVQRPLLYRDMYGYEVGPRGTPTTDGQRIVTLGCDGGLYCRNLSDGSLLWSVQTNEKYGVVQNFFGVGSSPLLLDDRVIVAVGGSPVEDQQIAPGRLDRVIPNGSALVAFDLDSGKEIWRCGDDLASYSSPRTMQIGSKTIVLLLARDHLLAVDPAVGKVLWKQYHRAEILESVNAMIPVVDGDQVFISECYQVGSLMMQVSLDGAQKVWQDPPRDRRSQSMRCHWSTPILVDGFLYGCSGRNNPDSDFRCVEFKTGKVQWSDERQIRSSVAHAGEHLVVLDEDGSMQIIRPNSEKLDVVASFNFGDHIRPPCWAAPIIVGNRMLIRGDRNVLCLAIQTN